MQAKPVMLALFFAASFIICDPETSLADSSVLANVDTTQVDPCYACIAVNPVTNRIYVTGETYGHIPDDQQ